MLNQLLDHLFSKIHEAETSLPPEQEKMKLKYGPATDKEMMTISTYPSEPVVKFWLLNDGTLIFVTFIHGDNLSSHHVTHTSFYKTGAIRVKSDTHNRVLMLSYTEEPNSKQITTLQRLSKLHNINKVLIEYGKWYDPNVIPMSSSSELSAILRGEVRNKSLASQFHEHVNQNPYNSLLNEDGNLNVPLDMDDNELVDMEDHPILTNSDGTITLYHRTNEQSAKEIQRTGKFISKEGTGEVFFSSQPEGQGEGYGDFVVAIKINPRWVRISDAFRNEVHVAVMSKYLFKSNLVKKFKHVVDDSLSE